MRLNKPAANVREVLNLNWTKIVDNIFLKNIKTKKKLIR